MSDTKEQTTAYDPEKMRRANGIRRLANRLGCVNPNTICEPFLSLMLETPTLHPVLLEKLLIRRGWYDPDAGESIKDCLVRRFGQEWADLAETLL